MAGPAGTATLLRYTFVASVWLLIAISFWQARGMFVSAGMAPGVPAPFAGRAVMGPLVIGGMALLMWFRFFWQEREGARIFAGMMAFFMLSILLVTALSGFIEGSIGASYFGCYVFIAVAHLGYALFGRERSW